MESSKKQCSKCGKKLTFLNLIQEEDFDGNEVILCGKCYPDWENENDKKIEEKKKKDFDKQRKQYVDNIKEEIVDYYCAKCNTQVREDDFHCPKCKAILPADNAVKIRKIKRDLISNNNTKYSGVKITQIIKNVRTRGHGIIERYCPICNKITDQEIQEQRPLDLAIICFIPFSHNSKRFDIWYKCEECNFIVGNEKDERIKEKIIKQYPAKSEYIKEEAKMQVEVCDICFFEENKKCNLSRYEQKIGNIILHLCEKHKNWIEQENKKGKLTTHKELMTRISKWYNQD